MKLRYCHVCGGHAATYQHSCGRSRNLQGSVDTYVPLARSRGTIVTILQGHSLYGFRTFENGFSKFCGP